MKKHEVLDFLTDTGNLDFSDKLGNIRLPVMVVCGSKDKANLSAARRLAKELPNSRLEIVAGGGHELNRTNPKEFASLLEGMVAWSRSLDIVI